MHYLWCWQRCSQNGKSCWYFPSCFIPQILASGPWKKIWRIDADLTSSSWATYTKRTYVEWRRYLLISFLALSWLTRSHEQLPLTIDKSLLKPTETKIVGCVQGSKDCRVVTGKLMNFTLKGCWIWMQIRDGNSSGMGNAKQDSTYQRSLNTSMWYSAEIQFSRVYGYLA